MKELMSRHIKIVLSLLVVGALTLLSQAAPAFAAAGMQIAPSSGTPDTSFTLSAGGFAAGESVVVSVVGPNNTGVGSGTTTADSQGNIEFSAQVPDGSPAGTYTAIAQGQSSHRQYSASFTVTAPSSSPAAPSVVPAAAGMSISPTSGNYDTTFTATVGGFVAGETVSVWVVSPSVSIVGTATATADATGAISYSGQIPYGSAAGKYTVYARGLTSGHLYSASLTLNVPAVSYSDWEGQYFANSTLSGSPVLVRNDAAINFDWGAGSPSSAVPADNFSARWTRNQYFDAGTYQFTSTVDDGMRVWVGDTLVIDAWNTGPGTYTGQISLAAGTYPIKVEYFELAGNAIAKLSWAQTSTITERPWTGSYYSNMTLSGSPTVVQQDATLNFDWAGASPVTGVPGTQWSARWVSSQYAPTAGTYTVYAYADDGVRVWVDGNLVIDGWQDQTPTLYTGTINLAAGWHNVRVEYYQDGSGSLLRVEFAAP